jgi:hypothetical protein
LQVFGTFWKCGGDFFGTFWSFLETYSSNTGAPPARASDCGLSIGAIHEAWLGRAPRLVAADTAFYFADHERAAKAKG